MSAASPRIAVDARSLNNEHLRGMGKCLLELINRSPRHYEWTLLSNRPDLPFHMPENPNTRRRIFEMRGHRWQLWEQVALPRAAQKVRADLLYCPAMSLPFWQPVPTIVTLHDAMPWVLNEAGWPAGFYRDRTLPAALGRAARIITDSEGSRVDIISLWPGFANQTVVVPIGVSEAYLSYHAPAAEGTLARYGVRQPYLLYLGGSNPRKRLDWALRVFENVKSTTAQLVVCGVEADARVAMLRSIPDRIASRICFAPFVPEADMPAIYAHAAAVLYPTSYEGFGLPALEAQATGTPVLFSNVKGLSELRGPGADVLPADDLHSWVCAVERHLAVPTDPAAAAKAREWASGFSWQNYVNRMLAQFSEVLAG